MRILLTLLLFGLLAHSASACEGQVGDTIFEDNFADNLGGWTFSDNFALRPPGAQIIVSANEKGTARSELNQTFRAREADYCAEMSFPKNAAAVDDVGTGVEFLAADYRNLFVAEVYRSGKIELDTEVDGKWTTIWSMANPSLVKIGPDAVNAVRAVIKGNLITVYVNGKTVRAVRAGMPDGELKFGILAEFTTASKESLPFPVKSVKVTKGQ